jgi:hypothetical protein
MEPSLDAFEDLENKIDKLKDEFYSSSSKHVFFKKTQKFECANKIITKLPIEALLGKTCRILLTHKLVYIDYTIFRSYASPETFDIISDYIIQTFREFRDKNGYLVVGINLDKFTISAFERYKHIIQIFCDKCFRQQNEFSKSLAMFSIYNVPTTFDSIKKIISPFVMEDVIAKINLFGKVESEPILSALGVL